MLFFDFRRFERIGDTMQTVASPLSFETALAYSNPEGS